MGTLLYSPGIKVLIETAKTGVIDISDDLVSGSWTVTENEVGSCNLVLANHRRKYDGVFTPNDRISIQSKRISWVQSFSGYLNSVPYFSVYPREVVLTASDTFKRLQYRPWDPGTPEAWALLHAGPNGNGSPQETDGGIRDKVVRLLTEVGEWPDTHIHIGRLPKAWYDKVADVQQKLADRVIVNEDSIGAGGVTHGVSVTGQGTTTLPSTGRFTGTLPATSGKGSWFGGPNGGAYGAMELTGESGVSPKDPWYCAMRWPYKGYVNGRIRAMGTPEEVRKAREWWKAQRILVTNPANGKSVVLRPADWGPGGVPSADDRAIDVSKIALEALGASTDTSLLIRFATPNSSLGPARQLTKDDERRLDQGLPPRSAPGVPESKPAPEQPHPAANLPPPTVQGASGLRFTDEGGLQGNARAARDFIKANWVLANKYGIGGFAKRNVAGTSKPSGHARGVALDVMVNGGGVMPDADQKAFGNSVAMWFLSNPQAFGLKYVIWGKQINTGSGWRAYTHPGGSNITLDHYDHVHLEFEDTGQAGVGPMGNPWPGSDMSGFGEIAPGGGVIPEGGGVGDAGNLINSFNWYGSPQPESVVLTGIRALMNDVPLLGTVKQLVTASMRSCMAAPNGDFIAWFPDYFGNYGTAGRMTIKDIELVGDGFTMQWDDSRLITHQYATGSVGGGFNSHGGVGGAVDTYMQSMTAGIATVEFPEIMEALFNASPDDPKAAGFLDAERVLQRFGARPDHQEIGSITGPQAEFWYALSLFQRNWAQQFSSRVNLTFMPEVFPGMLVTLDTFGFAAYVTSVTHSFAFGDKAGFTTDVDIYAPSAMDGSGLYGLPRSGLTPAARKKK